MCLCFICNRIGSVSFSSILSVDTRLGVENFCGRICLKGTGMSRFFSIYRQNCLYTLGRVATTKAEGSDLVLVFKVPIASALRFLNNNLCFWEKPFSLQNLFMC